MTGVESYEMMQSTGNGNWQRVGGFLTSASYTVRNLQQGATSCAGTSFRVRAFKCGAPGLWSIPATYSKKTVPTAPAVTANESNCGLRITWR